MFRWHQMGEVTLLFLLHLFYFGIPVMLSLLSLYLVNLMSIKVLWSIYWRHCPTGVILPWTVQWWQLSSSWVINHLWLVEHSFMNFRVPVSPWDGLIIIKEPQMQIPKVLSMIWTSFYSFCLMFYIIFRDMCLLFGLPLRWVFISQQIFTIAIMM